ncbi:MAG TPA: response regulator transcription factor [Actinocrinis sp.]|nr:response regulator transcription factor [Actinocrinis sp.]
MIRVLIADDQALVRGAFEVLVNSAPTMTVVGAAADGAEAIELALRERPDVVLMDVRMPKLDGIEATRRIVAASRERAESGAGAADPEACGARVLMLTTFDLDEYVFAALRAGASGFLLKDTAPAQLLDAISVVAAGEALLAPTVTRRLIEQFSRSPQPSRGPRVSLDGVTDREHEVLALVGRGLSNTEIAEHLHLAAPTVKTHVSRLLMKLGARDRAQLVIVAYESGLLEQQPFRHTPT